MIYISSLFLIYKGFNTGIGMLLLYGILVCEMINVLFYTLLT